MTFLLTILIINIAIVITLAIITRKFNRCYLSQEPSNADDVDLSKINYLGIKGVWSRKVVARANSNYIGVDILTELGCTKVDKVDLILTSSNGKQTMIVTDVEVIKGQNVGMSYLTEDKDLFLTAIDVTKLS